MARRRVVISFIAPRLDAGFFAWLVRIVGSSDAPHTLTIRIERLPEDG